MEIRLSDHFDCGRLVRFTLPTIAMMVFTSVYGVVDGFFVANYAGMTSFSAVNFIMPFLMIAGTPGFMLGAGGSALVGRLLGEGDSGGACRVFSLLVAAGAVLGVAMAAAGAPAVRLVAELLGATGGMLDECVLYGGICMAGAPTFFLQMEFQALFITAGKPRTGFLFSVGSGATNMLLDALFIGVFGWGTAGAAAATVAGQAVGGFLPVLYFARRNPSELRLVPFRFDGGALLRVCANGSSELMNNVSMSLVAMLYNMQLMRFAGQMGVAAFGVIMYVNMIFIAVFIGYAVGSAPLFSYNLGARRPAELDGLLRRSAGLLAAASLAMFACSELLAEPLTMLFSAGDGTMQAMTCRGFRIFSFSFLAAGFSIFGSSLFTALNDGLTSALIAFLRTLLFQTAAVLLLPELFGIDGIWFSLVAAEVLAVLVTAFFAIRRRREFYPGNSSR